MEWRSALGDAACIRSMVGVAGANGDRRLVRRAELWGRGQLTNRVTAPVFGLRTRFRCIKNALATLK